MKIAMVGVTGSGKTSFLAALYEQLSVQEFWLNRGKKTKSNKQSKKHISHSFSMHPTSSNFYDNLLQIGRWEEISFRRNGGLEFPEGTQNTTSWSFDLYEKQNEQQNCVCNIELIDYRGGLISDIKPGQLNQETRNQLARVARHIQHCKAVILFIDSIQLLYQPLPSLNTGIDRMYQILDALGRNYPNQELTVLVLLTKADGVAQPQKSQNYAPLTQKGIKAIRKIQSVIRRNPLWQGAIAPISAVGEAAKIERVKNDPLKIETTIIEPLTPMNVEHAVFYCISYGIDDENTTLKTRIVQNYKEADQIEESIQETQNKIETASQQVEKNEKRIQKIKNQLKKLNSIKNKSTGCLWWLFEQINSLSRIILDGTAPSRDKEALKEELQQKRRTINLLQADLNNLERELRIKRDSQEAIRNRQPITNDVIEEQKKCSKILRDIASKQITPI